MSEEKVEGLKNALDIVNNRARTLEEAAELIKDNIDYLEDLEMKSGEGGE